MLSRGLILVFGPALLIGGCYFLTIGRESSAHSGSLSGPSPIGFDVQELEAAADAGLTRSAEAPPSESSSDAPGSQCALGPQCDRRAQEVSRQLAGDHRMIVRPPYILAGDLSAEELEYHYTQTVLPTARALRLAYFDAPINEPVTLLLFSGERAYRNAARSLDRRNTANYYGYYVRPDRRIVLNIGTGEGTLSHELVHALGHFDFPDMPEWFDEGFASIYEEADFTEDGLQLIGVSNWRLNHLLQAIQQRRLQTLASLLTSRRIRSERQEVDYAHARYFCLYLQDRGLLPFFYRKFRSSVAHDPGGFQTLCEIFDTTSLDAVDRDFRRWVIELYQEVRRTDSVRTDSVRLNRG
ncbi:MAG: hypothetical protein VB858_01660 [Planctomycetaceae bacterium]